MVNPISLSMIETNVGTFEDGNLLPVVILVCHLPGWRVDTKANIHIVLVFLCFLLIKLEILTCWWGMEHVWLFVVLVWSIW
jgi:hypothetical protein